ncbi:MAG: permease [Opitutae bacterium]|nr:permease [Opitutae bacterium]MDG1301875.1 permease [Opitutae bacterium]
MLTELINHLIYDWAGMDPESKFTGAVHFFFYDTIKIFLLLAAMIFVIGVLRSYLPDHKLKQWMSRGGLWGNFIAALFGAITPFCSCSSIPIFISLLRAGVPLGVTFSFLITSPIINEYLVVLMAGSFGIPITIAYVGSGLFIGTIAGGVLGKMRLEKHLEQDIINASDSQSGQQSYTVMGRIRYGFDEAVQVVRQIWLWVLIGVAIGAFIHNYVPEEMIHGAMAKAGIFSVPIATTLGVPMYGSCAAIVPIAVVLFQKGIPIGTALAFMMAMAALSLPEAIMLRRTMQLKLIGIYFGITTLAIIFTGYLLNALALYL